MTDGSGVASDGRRARLGAHRTLLPFVLAVVALYAGTAVYRQILRPYIAFDDWAYGLPQGTPGAGDLFARNLFEGRWLNYGWWLAVGQHGTPLVASLGFQLCYLAFVVGFASRLSRTWLGFLTAAALFVSPMWADLSYWPSAQTPSALVLAGAVWLLPLAGRRVRWLAGWLSAVALLGVLTYPPVAAVAFLVMVVDQIHRKVAHLSLLAVWFALSYAASVLVVFTFNWFAFGYFGLQIRPWRFPHPAHSLADVLDNAARYAHQSVVLMHVVWIPFLVGAAALLICLARRVTRRDAVVWLLATAVVVALEAVTTLFSGVSTQPRGSLWAWIVIVVPIVWTASAGTARWSARGVSALGAAGLLVVAIWGGLGWRASVVEHQATQSAFDAVGEQVARAHQNYPERRVVTFATSQDRSSSLFATNVRSLQWSLYRRVDVFPELCGPSLCAAMQREGLPGQASESVFLFRDVVVMVPPPPPAWEG